jgi:hypothetical protein
VNPLFTIHAGEFVAGDFIEGNFSGVNLWVPARDTGIDLLVTDSRNQKTVSLQVKFSRDYSAKHLPPISQKPLRPCGCEIPGSTQRWDIEHPTVSWL